MVDTLWEIFKCALLIFGILVVVSVIFSMLIDPFKKKKKQKQTKEFMLELQKIAEKCVKEVNEEKKNAKKTTRNAKKDKEN